jgi:hypothetical protein
VFEGNERYRSGSAPGALAPAVTHRQADGWCSVIGGYVVRDRSLGRRLYGRYVYGDLCQPRLWLSSLRRGSSRPLGPRVGQLVSFGEDGRGRIYAVSLDGPVYRLAPR